MFKPLVLRRNLSAFNKIPHSRIVQAAARDGHETVTIHRVRIQRPLFRKSRLVGAIAFGTAAYGLAKFLGLDVEVEEVGVENKKAKRSGSQADEEGWQEAGQEQDDEEADEDEDEDEAILFLPTGFSRPRRKTYYRSSDPEWQEFKRIATNPARVQKIREELAFSIRKLATQSAAHTLKLGKIDMSRGNVWIEFKFPEGPPIEYERPGIELTEDLAWRKATRPVNHIHHERLSRLLFPAEVASALYQDMTSKTGKMWKNFKISMGWDEGSQTETVQELMRRMGSKPRSPASATSVTATPGQLATSVNDTQRPSASSAKDTPDGLAKDTGFSLPNSKSMTLDLSRFRAEFKKAFKPYQLPAPRGTFIVVGLVEIHGTRARMTINVTAAYDPKQGKYVSINGAEWNFREHHQRPKGGP